MTCCCCCCCWGGLLSNTHFSFLDDSDRLRSGGHGERDFLGQSGGVIARDGENDVIDATAAAAAVATVFAMDGWAVVEEEEEMVGVTPRLFGPGFTFLAGKTRISFCFFSLSLAHAQRTLTL